MSSFDNFSRNLGVTNFNEQRRTLREPKPLNLTLIEYVILGIDGDVIAVRKYPPIKPKDLPKCMMSLEDYKTRGKP